MGGGGSGADTVEVLVENGMYHIARPLQGMFQIPHPQGLLVVKGHQHHNRAYQRVQSCCIVQENHPFSHKKSKKGPGVPRDTGAV